MTEGLHSQLCCVMVQAGRPPSAGRSTASRASSRASFSRRTSALGAPAPVPAASHSDTAEIQPARTVSEDSDSEGATLFQPVEFREHVQVWQVMHNSNRHMCMHGVCWTSYVYSGTLPWLLQYISIFVDQRHHKCVLCTMQDMKE